MFHEIKSAIDAVEKHAPSISEIRAEFGGNRPWFVSEALIGVIGDKWPDLKPLVLQRLRDAASEWDNDGYAVKK